MDHSFSPLVFIQVRCVSCSGPNKSPSNSSKLYLSALLGSSWHLLGRC